jgi:hypothetical protein
MSSGTHRKREDQSQEGKVKDSVKEWKGLGTEEK